MRHRREKPAVGVDSHETNRGAEGIRLHLDVRVENEVKLAHPRKCQIVGAAETDVAMPFLNDYGPAHELLSGNLRSFTVRTVVNERNPHVRCAKVHECFMQARQRRAQFGEIAVEGYDRDRQQEVFINAAASSAITPPCIMVFG